MREGSQPLAGTGSWTTAVREVRAGVPVVVVERRATSLVDVVLCLLVAAATMGCLEALAALCVFEGFALFYEKSAKCHGDLPSRVLFNIPL